MKSLWTVPTLQAQEEALAAQEVKRRRRQRGFTLIEMLAVVIILAIVAGVGFVVVNNQIEAAREKTDIANMRTIADAAQRALMDNKTILEIDDLQSQGYLGSIPVDPWGTGAKYDVSVSAPTSTSDGSIKAVSPHTFTTLPDIYKNSGLTLDSNNKVSLIITIPKIGS